MEFLNKITDEEVKQMPKACFAGPIEVISDFKAQNGAAEYLLQHRVIGFDTESRASFQKGVVNKIALLQLSAGGRAFLIRVNRVKLSQGIIKLLESPDHLKIGVALGEDIRELQSVTDFKPSGFFDLQKVVSEYQIAELSLKKIAAIVLGVQISKAQRLSNWEATSLTDCQVEYAATDAWICEEIFSQLDISDEILEKGITTIQNRRDVARKSNRKERRKVKKVEQKEENIKE